MLRSPRWTRIVCAFGAAIIWFGIQVGDPEHSRGDVQIIGEPPSPQAGGEATAKPDRHEQRPLLTPASPSPSLDSPVTGGMATPPPQSISPDEKAPESLPPPSTPKNADSQIKKSGNWNIADQLNSAIQLHHIKMSNQAGLSVQIVSGSAVSMGDLLSLQVSTKKPGYLILVDVDADGKLTQIYPSAISLVEQGAEESTNHLEPDKSLQDQNRDSPQTAFELVASPPAGTAMVVAMLSDRPVQLVDLPDIPASLLGSAGAVDYLTKRVNELRITRNAGKELDTAHWSFAVKFYSIR
jgi:Domain of unknown function (DUF4384)